VAQGSAQETPPSALGVALLLFWGYVSNYWWMPFFSCPRGRKQKITLCQYLQYARAFLGCQSGVPQCIEFERMQSGVQLHPSNNRGILYPRPLVRSRTVPRIRSHNCIKYRIRSPKKYKYVDGPIQLAFLMWCLAAMVWPYLYLHLQHLHFCSYPTTFLLSLLSQCRTPSFHFLVRTKVLTLTELTRDGFCF